MFKTSIFHNIQKQVIFKHLLNFTLILQSIKNQHNPFSNSKSKSGFEIFYSKLIFIIIFLASKLFTTLIS